MSVPGRVLAFAGAVVILAIGATLIEARFRQQDVESLRQEVAELRARADAMLATANQANLTAKQAMDRADEARTLALTTRQAADQLAARSAGVIGSGPPTAQQPTATADEQDVKRGRDLALLICTACHVVASDQPLPPRLVPPGPDFQLIANRPATTDKSLHQFLVVPHGRMPGIPLADYLISPLVSYILSLRDQH